MLTTLRPHLTHTNVVAWILGAVSVAFLISQSNGFDLGGIVFIALVSLWVLAPWAVLASGRVPLTTPARATGIAACAVLGVWAMSGTDDSSTGALAFLVLPVVQHAVIATVALVDGVASRFRRRNA
jgi:hypothetical protein